MADTKQIAEEIYNTIQETVAQAKLVDRGDGFDLKDVRAILNSVDLVLTEIEKRSTAETLTGAEKKEVAIEVLVKLLDFDIPWVPNFLEGKVKTYAINFVIDYTVEILNKKLKKNWLE